MDIEIGAFRYAPPYFQYPDETQNRHPKTTAPDPAPAACRSARFWTY